MVEIFKGLQQRNKDILHKNPSFLKRLKSIHHLTNIAGKGPWLSHVNVGRST